ncbi:MAG: CarD family transcriptional regulator [Clostridia bacterium]|nr:CarD family transcriptional regulator [Clostridia bacterium]
MFEVGDTVCYPLHGIGTIQSIEKTEVLGRIETCYLIHLHNTRMTAMLPVETAESLGLRKTITPKECEKLFEYFKTAEPCIGNSNWNQRYRENMDKLKTGDPKGIVDVILCLGKRNTMRPLSSGEGKMLSNAKSILFTEIATVLNIGIDEVETRFK